MDAVTPLDHEDLHRTVTELKRTNDQSIRGNNGRSNAFRPGPFALDSNRPLHQTPNVFIYSELLSPCTDKSKSSAYKYIRPYTVAQLVKCSPRMREVAGSLSKMVLHCFFDWRSIFSIIRIKKSVFRVRLYIEVTCIDALH